MIYNSDTLSFQIPDAYRYSHPDGHFFVKARPFASLSFRISGLADFRFGDKSLAAKPGNVMFVPSGVPFEVEYLGSEYFVIELADCHYGEPELITLKNPTEIFLLFSDLLQCDNRPTGQNPACTRSFLRLRRIRWHPWKIPPLPNALGISRSISAIPI